MAISGPFNVWIADDQISGPVAANIAHLYYPPKCVRASILFSDFFRAQDASQAAFRLNPNFLFPTISSDKKASSQLPPDVAVIDLNFHDSWDADFLKGDHIKDGKIRVGIEDKTKKNAAGFWVAREIMEAAPQVIIKLYTADPKIQMDICWAVAPSRLCEKPFLDIEYKHGDPDEIVQIIEKMLVEAGKARIRRHGLPWEVMQVCLELKTFGLKRRLAFNNDPFVNARIRLLEAAEELRDLLPSPTSTDDMQIYPHVRFPKMLLQISPTPARINLAISGSTYAKEADYHKIGLSDQYSKLKDAIKNHQDLLGTLKPDTAEITSFNELAVSANAVNLELYFPNVSRWVYRFGNINYFDEILRDVTEAIKIAPAGDYHWALMVALKSVKFVSAVLPQAQTKLAEACHGNEDHQEGELNEELNTLVLPSATKAHLMLGMPVTGMSDREPNQTQEPLRSIGWSFSLGTPVTKNWIHKLRELPDLLKDVVDLEAITIAPEVENDDFLTDWRLFVHGPDAMVSKLRRQFNNAPLTLDVSPGDKEHQLRFILRASLLRPLDSLPTGGLAGVLSCLQGWGNSTWRGTVKTGDTSKVFQGGIWPEIDPLPIADHEGSAAYYFMVETQVMNYCKTRYFE